MAITSWTSEGMTWADLTNQPVLYNHRLALRNAMKERCDVTGVAMPLGWETEDMRRNITASDMATFTATMTALIPYFANQTVNGGDYNFIGGGFSDTFVPRWTQALLLADIGDSERYSLASSRPIFGRWLKQQYEILNRLVWTWKDMPSSQRTARYEKTTGFHPTFSGAVSEWNALAWGAATGSVNAQSSYEFDERGYRIFSEAWDITLTGWSTDYNQTLDFYTFFSTIDSIYTSVYEDPYYFVPEIAYGSHRIYKATSWETPFNDSSKFFEYAKFPAFLVSETTGIGNHVKGLYLSPNYGGFWVDSRQAISVHKWNVTDGFKFVA